MSRLQLTCPAVNCAAPMELVNELTLLGQTADHYEFPVKPWSTLLKLKCGHLVHKEHLAATETSLAETSFYSLDGLKKTRHYQVEGFDFIKQSGFNCLVADQQGLGKTIEALLILRENPKELLPVLILVKGSTIWQWQREIKEWFKGTPDAVWMIRDGRGFIPPGFSIYLMSMDTLKAYVKPKGDGKTKGVKERQTSKYATTSNLEFEVSPALKMLGLKFLIADEVHSFKNTDSKRSQALVELIRLLGLDKKIFLSGTPIKNRADEYFIPLNLLDPLNFSSMDHFKRRFLKQDETGRWSRIDPYCLDSFKKTTAPYIIRRERNQVLTELPKFSRVFEEVKIESEILTKLYNAELDKLAEKDSEKANLTYNDIKEQVMTMRRIIGMAKAELILDVVEDFMDSTEDEKLVIGVHHHAVRDFLLAKLSKYKPLVISDESADRKQWTIDRFRQPERRLMIVNIIAGGTGLNLQFCNNCIVLERQWNSADEEQFEDRFNRIGQTLPVTAAYPKAIKTIDEWFSNMVEEKRAIFGDTVAIDATQWISQGDVNDLVNWAINNRL